MLSERQSLQGSTRTYDECSIMLLNLVDASARRVIPHRNTQRVLVPRTRVPLKNLRRNEWLQHEESTEIDTMNPIYCPIPGNIQWRSPRIRPGIVAERPLRVLYPCEMISTSVIGVTKISSAHTESTKRIAISELRPIFGNDGATITTALL